VPASTGSQFRVRIYILAEMSKELCTAVAVSESVAYG
jgi:hypothetical protein